MLQAVLRFWWVQALLCTSVWGNQALPQAEPIPLYECLSLMMGAQELGRGLQDSAETLIEDLYYQVPLPALLRYRQLLNETIGRGNAFVLFLEGSEVFTALNEGRTLVPHMWAADVLIEHGRLGATVPFNSQETQTVETLAAKFRIDMTLDTIGSQIRERRDEFHQIREAEHASGARAIITYGRREDKVPFLVLGFYDPLTRP